VLSKTHHALVDGVSGIDIMSVLFDAKAEPSAPPSQEGKRWLPAPTPSRAQLLAEALVERMTVPAEVVRGARALIRGPRRVAQAALGSLAGVGAMARVGLSPAPRTPYNERIGPHRRFTWVRMNLGDVTAIKNVLGGTVNDAMLAIVTGALGRHLRRRRVDTDALELRAMVPVSVRSEEARGALGNQVTAMMAPLPVGLEEPVSRLERISAAMSGLKSGGQAVGAQVLTELSGFAPPNIMSQAARVVARQRMFNLVVTNVPGPQFPLYLAGRELKDLFPMVPLAPNQAVGIAIMSYNGTINFGLVGDYDLMSDLDELAADLEASLAELADAAGVELAAPPKQPAPRRRPARTNGHKPGRRIGSSSAVTAGGGDE
jgi:WS/DGAT/MGAT family acyltransferase